MEPGTREQRALSFGSVAEAYERARPGYPPEAVAWLAGRAPRDVVDLGAGTGKLTRQLAAAGHRVVAIEPLAEMRAVLARTVPGVRVLEGTGEAMPLPGASADVVTVAQAFHWFDQAAAVVEIARVLRPGGTLGLVWNVRDEREEWVAQLSDAMVGRTGIEHAAVIDDGGLFGPVEEATFDHVQEVGRVALRELVLSRSHCAVLTDDERTPVLERIDELFDEHARDGVVRLPYRTECFRAVRR